MEANHHQEQDGKLTVGKILRDLDPGQLWGFLVALATVVATAFYIGQRFPVAAPTARATAGAVPCSRISDWPKGRWWLWGRLESVPTAKNTDHFTRIPQFAPEVVFTSDHSWEVLTDETAGDARKKILTARANEPLSPGQTLKFQGTSGTDYTNTETLTGSDDGCMLNGTFADSNGNSGSIHFLYQASQYYVSAK
jgi:hypothetical protein